MTEQAQLILEQCPNPGLAVDIGANDGTFLSNTIDLERLGWRVLCIEPNPYYGVDLWASRKEVVVGACGKENAPALFFAVETSNNKYAAHSSLKHKQEAMVFEVQVKTLDWYLEQWGVPQLDVLCADVEGGEEDILLGFDLAKWKPKVICLESWEAGNKYGHMLPGYTLVKEVQDDRLYLRNDEI